MTARRSPSRNPLTARSSAILANVYAGQIPAVVIERALTRMAEADRKRARKAAREGSPS